MLVKTYGCALYGINAVTITVEVNIEQGVNFFMVGLPDSAVKESHQRIEAALRYIGYRLPGKKVVINMAPADIKKEGSSYDLALAIGILGASDQLTPANIGDYIIMGELSLDGGVMPIKGALSIAIEARRKSFKGLILPLANAREAAIVEGIEVYGVENITEIIDFFNGKTRIKQVKVNIEEEFFRNLNNYEFDFSDVKGHDNIII